MPAPTATLLDHDSTLVLALELSGKEPGRSGAVLPGVSAGRAAALPGTRHGGVAAADRAMEGRSAAGRPNQCAGPGAGLRLAATGSGSRVICWRAASRCRSCIQRASRWNDAGAGRRLTASTSTCCCGRCWRGCEASHACARSCVSRARPRRTCAARKGSASVW